MNIKNHTNEKLHDISKVIENPRNPNKHSDSQIAMLTKIIEFQGWRIPIVVSNRSGFIVRGHGRLMSARKLGLEKVPVSFQDYESEAQEWADLIADNRIAELAEMDRSELKDIIEQLDTGEIDLDLTGFDQESLNDLMSEFFEPEEGLTDDDEIPEEVEPRCKPGDLWKLGEHRLMCGDSTSEDNIQTLIKSEEEWDLLTDPPYGINAEKMVLGSGKKNFHRGEWDSQIPKFIPLLAKFNKKIIWGGNYLSNKLDPTNDWLCWYKKNDGLSFSEFELAWTNLGKNCRLLSHHWSGEEKKHPTQKPLKVFEWCISFLGENIFDLFLGSGSTLIACEKLKRKCFGMELDPHYCDVIIQRWEDFTGKKAEKIN